MENKPHATEPTEAERFFALRRQRQSGATPRERTLALAGLINLGLNGTNPLVRQRVADFLLSAERVLVDFDDQAGSGDSKGAA